MAKHGNRSRGPSPDDLKRKVGQALSEGAFAFKEQPPTEEGASWTLAVSATEDLTVFVTHESGESGGRVVAYVSLVFEGMIRRLFESKLSPVERLQTIAKLKLLFLNAGIDYRFEPSNGGPPRSLLILDFIPLQNVTADRVQLMIRRVKNAFYQTNVTCELADHTCAAGSNSVEPQALVNDSTSTGRTTGPGFSIHTIALSEETMRLIESTLPAGLTMDEYVREAVEQKIKTNDADIS